MTAHNFTLAIIGPDLEAPAALDALYEAGCDDAAFGTQNGVRVADFDRDAPTVLDAVLSAIRQVEGAVPGAHVIHVLPGDFVTLTGIAERTGRSKESIRLLVAGERGPGGFPAPVRMISDARPIWSWSSVAQWFADFDPDAMPVGKLAEAELFAELNDALLERWRRMGGLERPHVPPRDRARVRALVEA